MATPGRPLTTILSATFFSTEGSGMSSTWMSVILRTVPSAAAGPPARPVAEPGRTGRSRRRAAWRRRDNRARRRSRPGCRCAATVRSPCRRGPAWPRRSRPSRRWPAGCRVRPPAPRATGQGGAHVPALAQGAGLFQRVARGPAGQPLRGRGGRLRQGRVPRRVRRLALGRVVGTAVIAAAVDRRDGGLQRFREVGTRSRRSLGRDARRAPPRTKYQPSKLN